jgi:phospholipid N-methyltransferase
MIMNSKYLFFVNFLKNPLRNASIIPSSESSCKAMVNGIDFSKVKTIIELGPGDGVFTEQVLKKCRPDTKIIVIELEKSYIHILKKKFGKKVIVENVCASHIDEILRKHKIKKVDLIISGLPFLPEKVKNKLFTSIKQHTDRGTVFRFFTYMPPIMKKIYKDLPLKKKSFTWKNIPPFWVYGTN